MSRSRERNPPIRQRGWVGLIVLVIALVIVGMLANDGAADLWSDGHGHAGVADDARRPGIARRHQLPCRRRAKRWNARAGWSKAVQQQANDLSKRIDEAQQG